MITCMLLFLDVAPVLDPPILQAFSDDAKLCDVESWSTPPSSIRYSESSKSNEKGSPSARCMQLGFIRLGFSGQSIAMELGVEMVGVQRARRFAEYYYSIAHIYIYKYKYKYQQLYIYVTFLDTFVDTTLKVLSHRSHVSHRFRM